MVLLALVSLPAVDYFGLEGEKLVNFLTLIPALILEQNSFGVLVNLSQLMRAILSAQVFRWF